MPIVGTEKPVIVRSGGVAGLPFDRSVDTSAKGIGGLGRTLDVEPQPVGLVAIAGIAALGRVGLDEVRKRHAHFDLGAAERLESVVWPGQAMEVHVMGGGTFAAFLPERL